MTNRVVSRPGRPRRLTQKQVVAAARELAARQGTESLTMRQLAKTLEVMPNALYTYFPDKSAILDAVLDDLVGDVAAPGPHVGWQEALVSLMSSYRRALLAQPGLIALTASRPMVGPNALRLREDMLAILRASSLDDGDAVSAYLALFAYTTGFVTFETGRVPGKRDEKQRTRTFQLHANLSKDDFPSTRALARRLRKRPGDAEFKRGLSALITGFAEG